MQTKVLEITVEGEVGTGKSHVLATIEQGLKAAYGQSVQVVSCDLFEERGLVGSDEEMSRPNLKDTVFVLRETNPHMSDRRDKVDRSEGQRPALIPNLARKHGFLHVVGPTYVVLSPEGLLAAAEHAQVRLGYGDWDNLGAVAKTWMPEDFPAVCSFIYNVDKVDAGTVLDSIESEPYPQFFANLTGQQCSGC